MCGVLGVLVGILGVSVGVLVGVLFGILCVLFGVLGFWLAYFGMVYLVFSSTKFTDLCLHYLNILC